MGEGSYRRITSWSSGVEVFECSDCGVLVVNQAVHDRFHSILSSHAWALAVIKTRHLSAEIHDRYDIPERIDSRRFDNWSADALAEVMGTLTEAEKSGG